MSNVEGNDPSKFCGFDILLFCGSLFRPGEVSYKNTEDRMANEQLTTDYGQWWHGQTRISFVRGSAQLTTDD